MDGKRKGVRNSNEGLIALNTPRPAAVDQGTRGEPKGVVWKGTYRKVMAINDTWRIDDEWWRDEIARRYYVVELEGGRTLTLYRDLVADAWYAQPYAPPRSERGIA